MVILMAILKHIASKNADYSETQRYLTFQHNEYTNKPILDENGRLIPREEYYVDGINCDPFSFDMECRELNAKYHKNQNYNEVKSHHYILSFDPKDSIENGLTGERAQQLGLEFAKKNFPGHQTFVCTHTDGHNESGNIHVHIVINSLRKFDVERQPFIQEHGYDTRDSLDDSFAEIKNHASNSRKELKSIEDRLRATNEQIHYTGQFLANKSVYQQFCKSRNKGQFRKEHSAEIALYEAARKFLKEHSTDGKLPSMKLLKAEKEQLLQQKNEAQQTYHYYRDYKKELQTVCTNVDMILGQPHNRQSEKQKSTDIS